MTDRHSRLARRFRHDLFQVLYIHHVPLFVTSAITSFRFEKTLKSLHPSDNLILGKSSPLSSS